MASIWIGRTRRALIALGRTPVREWFFFYLFALTGFALLRVALAFAQVNHGHTVEWSLLPAALAAGLLPDLMMTGFIALIPSAIAATASLIRGRWTRAVRISALALSSVLLGLAFLASILDLEFWPIFGERINSVVLAWLQTPLTSLRAAFRSFPAVTYTLVFLGAAALAVRGFVLVCRRIDQHPSFAVRAAALLIIVGAGTLAARGTIGARRTIEMGAPFFGQNLMMNQLALNSGLNLALSIYSEQEFRGELSEFRSASAPNHGGCAPANVRTSVHANGRSVFVIIAESLTAKGVRALGGLQDPYLTPEIDSLIAGGVSFDNFYSNNTHTGQGIFNIFTGIPNPPGPSLTATRFGMQPRTTWLSALRDAGYQTSFFMTHDPLFDNMKAFLKTSGAQTVVAEPEYPGSEPRGPWGVFDKVMYDEAVQRLTAHRAKSTQPVAWVLLTATNHTPYEWLPDPLPFPPITGANSQQKNAFRYTDWAIGNFVRQIRAIDPDSIIVITGDHGQLLSVGFQRSDILSNYYHVPLVVSARNHPLVRPGSRLQVYGSHIDIGATLLDLAGVKEIRPGAGTSLFQAHEGAVPLVLNDGIGLLDASHFYFQFRSGLVQVLDTKTLMISGQPEALPVYRRRLTDTFRAAYEKLEGGSCAIPRVTLSVAGETNAD